MQPIFKKPFVMFVIKGIIAAMTHVFFIASLYLLNTPCFVWVINL